MLAARSARPDAHHARQGQGRRGADVRRPAPRGARLRRAADRARPQGRDLRADRGSRSSRRAWSSARSCASITPGIVLDDEVLDPKLPRYLAALVPRGHEGDATVGPRVPRRDHRRAPRDRARRRRRRRRRAGPGRAARGARRISTSRLAPLRARCRVTWTAVACRRQRAGERATRRTRWAPAARWPGGRGSRCGGRRARLRARDPAGRRAAGRAARGLRRRAAVVLDEAAIANLELTETLIGARKQGSLLAVLDETVDRAGRRGSCAAGCSIR